MRFKLQEKSKELLERVGAITVLFAVGLLALHVSPAEAKIALFDYIFKTPAFMEEVQNISPQIESVESVVLPQSPETIKLMYLDATAYSSRPQETDASPFITADGSVVRDGIIATNVLPFGTKIRIPSLYGDKIFEVHDRMNARYRRRIDVWMEDPQEMRLFGIKRSLKIEVIEMGDGVKRWEQWKGRGAELYRIGKYGPADEPLPQLYVVLAANS